MHVSHSASVPSLDMLARVPFCHKPCSDAVPLPAGFYPSHAPSSFRTQCGITVSDAPCGLCQHHLLSSGLWATGACVCVFGGGLFVFPVCELHKDCSESGFVHQ